MQEKFPLNSPHVFKILPLELVVEIVSHLLAVDLYYLAQCDRYLLKLIFDQSPEKIRLLERKKIQSTKQYDTSDLYRKDLENNYSKQFALIQQNVWKSLVRCYFPYFDLNLNIRNWMQVVRRRVKNLKTYKPHLLPLNRYFDENANKPYSKNAIEEDEWQEDGLECNKSCGVVSNQELPEPVFIENCELVYECPMSLDDISFNKVFSRSSNYCNTCKKNVLLISSKDEFKRQIGKEGVCVAFKNKEEHVFIGLL
ncbi:hypothetical protein C9374_009699 [Naegleria lovaniensis]|uniref:F-box domain-containing protein n=1 Tax=Naegleria lovaniensis TaxID=51637 RepID=A0AA88H588_NAELO|nr:uncharacterized protein C9374_009699 [Naegleria lovaniensis]KAG2393122.1 hypothetical protein C9374_009699 [Naegleria lovaniensis]